MKGIPPDLGLRPRLHAVAPPGRIRTELLLDPFDRLLLAQALSEGAPLLTSDPQLARYPGPVREV